MGRERWRYGRSRGGRGRPLCPRRNSRLRWGGEVRLRAPPHGRLIEASRLPARFIGRLRRGPLWRRHMGRWHLRRNLRRVIGFRVRIGTGLGRGRVVAAGVPLRLEMARPGYGIGFQWRRLTLVIGCGLDRRSPRRQIARRALPRAQGLSGPDAPEIGQRTFICVVGHVGAALPLKECSGGCRFRRLAEARVHSLSAQHLSQTTAAYKQLAANCVIRAVVMAGFSTGFPTLARLIGPPYGRQASTVSSRQQLDRRGRRAWAMRCRAYWD